MLSMKTLLSVGLLATAVLARPHKAKIGVCCMLFAPPTNR